MSERHVHCAYFKYDDPNDVKGHCLLKNKEIEYFYHRGCDDMVLRPSVALAIYIKNMRDCEFWSEAETEAMDFIKMASFKDYPISKGEKG